MFRLLTSEGFHRALVADPSLIPSAIEESLRFEPPVLFLLRTVKDDTTIGTTQVVEGDRIVMGIASANRDESCYERSEEFRLDRAGEPEHLAFGAGPHLCLGNHLARMEAKVVVEEYLRRYEFGAMRLAPGFAFELMPHYLEYGPEHLEVVLAGVAESA